MKTLFLTLLTSLFFLLTYSSAPDDIKQLDVLSISFLAVIAVLVQSAIIRYFVQKTLFVNLFLAVFALGNIVTLNLIVSPFFNSLPRTDSLLYGQFIFLLIALFIIFTGFKVISETTIGVLFDNMLAGPPLYRLPMARYFLGLDRYKKLYNLHGVA